MIAISCLHSTIPLSPLTLKITPTIPVKLCPSSEPLTFKQTGRRPARGLVATAMLGMNYDSTVINDLCATAVSGAIALSTLKVFQETAKRGIFDQKMNRKLVHISIGLIFMLCWPMFSADKQGAFLISLVPGLNIIKMILIGSGLWKDDATVKSMSRSGDYRELLKGPLYYALAATIASAVYWRSSPIAIAIICNLCAGDGLADIIGRRFGYQKLPHNGNKSFAGSIAMAVAGFLASVAYMHYFSMFGFLSESWEMVWGFLAVSLGAALVESLPISTTLDDNLTVPLTSILLSSLVFNT
ncbi:unnamed protein product [Rhodiola kirilowii]